MKKSIVFFPVVFVFFLITGCGSNYNTDYAPPGKKARPAEVFPTDVGGNDALIERIKNGYQAMYGEKDVIIRIVQLANKVEADTFFSRMIVPEFDKMPSHFRGQVNGRWYAKGSDSSGMKAYGWVNNQWVFVIKAKSEVLFDETVEKLEYISK
jgi:hypothetical protein